MKVTKKSYLLGFISIVALLALIRLACEGEKKWTAQQVSEDVEIADTIKEEVAVATPVIPSERRPHAIRGVHSYHESFPDSNEVQLMAARQWGVTPVENRMDAEKRMNELVYININPYYQVDPLHSSIPYLVPRAAVMLQDIARAFQDSLDIKGIPLHKIIVTSVLRTREDVAKLKKHNPNATEQSCHLYGTTIDICYNRYQPITREVQNDTLKWVLSEVLRDMRQQERCYIKYEVKQGCFHLTVR
jgi:hypothetical protein